MAGRGSANPGSTTLGSHGRVWQNSVYNTRKGRVGVTITFLTAMDVGFVRGKV
jgi:hypothetical protein